MVKHIFYVLFALAVAINAYALEFDGNNDGVFDDPHKMDVDNLVDNVQPLSNDVLQILKAANADAIKVTLGISEADNAYVYIAYASDASGTGFTTTFNSSLDYIAIRATTTPIASPIASDFTGLWKSCRGPQGLQGDPGAKGDQGDPGVKGDQGDPGTNAYLYIAYAADASGTDFSLTPSPTRHFIAVKNTTTAIASPVASDFTGLWKQYDSFPGVDSDGANGLDIQGDMIVRGQLRPQQPVAGVFVPRHESSSELATQLLEPGEIATSTDLYDIRVGDSEQTPGGHIIFSPSKYTTKLGQEWTANAHGLNIFVSNFSKIVYGNGIYVGVGPNSNGNEGKAAISYDLKGWTPINIDSLEWGVAFDDIAYGNGVFVAVNRDALASVSTDGVNWSSYSIDETNGFANSIVYGNGKFVALQNATAAIYTSYDGINWNRHTSLSALAGKYTQIFALQYLNGRFILFENTDKIMESLDGISWTERTFTPYTSVAKLTYGNGKYYALAGSPREMYSSPDLITWTDLNHTAGNVFPSSCNLFFLHNMLISYNITYSMLYSYDGTTWYTGHNFLMSIKNFNYLNNQFVAISNTTSNQTLFISGIPYENIKSNGLLPGNKYIDDMVSMTNGKGIILTSPNGSYKKRIFINDSGTLTTVDVP